MAAEKEAVKQVNVASVRGLVAPPREEGLDPYRRAREIGTLLIPAIQRSEAEFRRATVVRFMATPVTLSPPVFFFQKP